MCNKVTKYAVMDVGITGKHKNNLSWHSFWNKVFEFSLNSCYSLEERHRTRTCPYKMLVFQSFFPLAPGKDKDWAYVSKRNQIRVPLSFCMATMTHQASGFSQNCNWKSSQTDKTRSCVLRLKQQGVSEDKERPQTYIDACEKHWFSEIGDFVPIIIHASLEHQTVYLRITNWTLG